VRQFRAVFIAVLAAVSVARTQQLTIAAAANLRGVADEIDSVFFKQSGMAAQFIYGASGTLTNQIRNGAPFDLFLSADTTYVNALYRDSLTAGPPRIYAYGTLVLWFRNKVDTSLGLNALLNDDVHSIAIANPLNAPYGIAALQSMKFFKVFEKVKPKLVYGESISQVNNYVGTRSVDAAFTAKSAMKAIGGRSGGTWTVVADSMHEPIAQGMATLRYGAAHHPETARAFYNLLFSAQAAALLRSYGYSAP
jgi:molybdate transport system substrate-binding protein